MDLRYLIIWGNWHFKASSKETKSLMKEEKQGMFVTFKRGIYKKIFTPINK